MTMNRMDRAFASLTVNAKTVCNITIRKKRIGYFAKSVEMQVFLYRVSECAYNQKSDDLEFCHVCPLWQIEPPTAMFVV